MLPARINKDFWDDWFEDFPIQRELMWKPEGKRMAMDISEKDDHYDVDVEIPGMKKEDIMLALRDGYLIVSAEHKEDKEEKDKAGKVIRRERYAGKMSRSVFVGKEVQEEDIKAKYEDGILKIVVPKKEPEKLPEPKQITIE